MAAAASPLHANDVKAAPSPIQPVRPPLVLPRSPARPVVVAPPPLAVAVPVPVPAVVAPPPVGSEGKDVPASDDASVVATHFAAAQKFWDGRSQALTTGNGSAVAGGEPELLKQFTTHLTAAAERGHRFSRVWLVRCHLEGVGGQKHDRLETRRWIEALYEQEKKAKLQAPLPAPLPPPLPVAGSGGLPLPRAVPPSIDLRPATVHDLGRAYESSGARDSAVWVYRVASDSGCELSDASWKRFGQSEGRVVACAYVLY